MIEPFSCNQLGCSHCIHFHQWVEMTKDKPTPKPEKCDHSNCVHDGVIRKQPKDEVEEKITKIDNWYGPAGNKLKEELRELVALARKT